MKGLISASTTRTTTRKIEARVSEVVRYCGQIIPQLLSTLEISTKFTTVS